MDLEFWVNPEGFNCSCGRHHSALPLRYLKIESGAVNFVPQALKAVGAKRPFIVTDNNTEVIAGNKVKELLKENNYSFSETCINGDPKLLPNELYLSRLENAFDETCDYILGVGSGVINDLCKMMACSRHLECGIVATAPSMDGYASNSSAMELKGVKTTVYTTCPSLVICDTEIMRNAPFDMLRSGFGDMAAKIISIADWSIAHLITGEYYCEEIARLMLDSCNAVLENADGILTRDEYSIRKMTEGLVLSGVASSCAGVSRPASGMEHTISHLLEMFALSRGAQPGFHGLQVGYGVREALKLYEAAWQFAPTHDTCAYSAANFNQNDWETELRKVFGEQAESLIHGAISEERNSTRNILRRGTRAVDVWPQIHEIIGSVLSQKKRLLCALDKVNIPDLSGIDELGYSGTEAVNAVLFSKDLRSRYIFTSLCFDIGLDIRKYYE